MPSFDLNSLNDYNTVPKPQSSTTTTTGKILIAVTGGVAIALTAVCASFVSPAFRKICLPYVPATDKQIANVLEALRGRTGTLLDLGSGDGRIVLEMAKHKFISHGIELNPWLVVYSKLDAFRKGLSENAKFYRQDLWKYNIAKYDNIVIFGVEQMMADLEKKLQRECNEKCHIIACRFPLPNMNPKRIVGQGIDRVWVYSCQKQ